MDYVANMSESLWVCRALPLSLPGSGPVWPYSPISDLLIAILELSSLFHFTVGVGLPVALHLSIMFSPSRTIMSLELSESSMFGGTAIEKREENDYQLLIIIENKRSQFHFRFP